MYPMKCPFPRISPLPINIPATSAQKQVGIYKYYSCTLDKIIVGLVPHALNAYNKATVAWLSLSWATERHGKVSRSTFTSYCSHTWRQIVAWNFRRPRRKTKTKLTYISWNDHCLYDSEKSSIMRIGLLWASFLPLSGLSLFCIFLYEGKIVRLD